MNLVDLSVSGIIAISAILGMSRGLLAGFGTMLPHAQAWALPDGGPTNRAARLQVSREGSALGPRPARH